MAIYFDSENQIFTLESDHTSYQMKADDKGFLLHLYYGKKISGAMDYLLSYYDRGFSGSPAGVMDRTYSMDVLPQEYPTAGTGDFRRCALVVKNGDGSESCDLRYVSHEIRKGKYGLKGLPAVYASCEEAETLEILLEDQASRVQVKLLYGVLEKEDIITRSALISNQGEGRVIIEKAASVCLDYLTGDYDLISFCGRHMMERIPRRVQIGYGNYTVGSRRGASSHQYNPAVIVARPDTTEEAGGCCGMMFVYSGNFLCEAEKDQFNLTRVVMGLGGEGFHYPLEQGEELAVPESVLAYSGQGFGELSNLFHRCIREHICRGKYSREIRPVLINSWEMAYFDFDGDTICGLAKEASGLGIDMVVMDDGWFGKRDDDNSGLGDWRVNEKKLGCTLKELTEKVNEMGMKFGIWIEPEMISRDSDLYREHPDWAMQIPGREPGLARNQLVLDFTRTEVREHVFEQICRMLDQGKIDYIKWDMNRSLSDVFSANMPDRDSQGKVVYEYVLGVYDFLEKLIRRYPDILIEGCCGGGGRFDAGMLYYTPQIWCSDNTDALDRVRIQYGTSFFYPASAVGSHVSAVPNHQTGRNISLHTRGVVAMAGTFGYELDPGKLTEEEKQQVKDQVIEYKRHAELISRGYYYRLSNPLRDVCGAWMFVSKDGSRALVSVVMLENHGNMPVTYVKLKGLKADALYEEAGSKKRFYGSALMEAGIVLPVERGEYLSYQMEFHMVAENG